MADLIFSPYVHLAVLVLALTSAHLSKVHLEGPVCALASVPYELVMQCSLSLYTIVIIVEHLLGLIVNTTVIDVQLLGLMITIMSSKTDLIIA